MIADAKKLRKAGFAIHWLRPNEKAPIRKNWSTASVMSVAQLKDTWREGRNIGVRLGEPSQIGENYLHLIDLDIRDESVADEAMAVLREYIKKPKLYPTVKSGSGGSSRHFYFVSDKAFPSKKLARSDGFEMVWDEKKGRDVKKHAWEIELFGTGKQAVVPPSIHPDTGKPYEWLIEFDEEDVPHIDSARITKWGVHLHDDTVEANTNKLGMTLAEARGHIEGLDEARYIEDRDGWRELGMALHHEFDGSQEAFDLWMEYSSKSEKFDLKDQKRVWKSFKGKARPVRMATIVAAARENRLVREFDDLSNDVDDFEDEDEEFNDDDLIGGSRKRRVEADDEVGEGHSHRVKTLPFDTEKMGGLDLNEDGTPKDTLPNDVLMLDIDPRTRGLMQYDEFSLEVKYRRKPNKLKGRRPRQINPLAFPLRDPINGELWSESCDNALREIIESKKRHGGWGLKITDRNLKAAIDLAALKYSFHPVREFLEAQKWDGTPRVETLFIDYLGSEDNAYHRDTARLMMVAAAARIFEPGCKFDYAAILEGGQGKRKSTFIHTLGCGRWFSELHGDVDKRKDMVEQMQNAWIVELPELASLKKAEVEPIKAFLAAREDNVRLAYAKRAKVYKRQCIFIGSTNDRKYLRDDTGNRRFWPIAVNVDSINIEKLKRNINQLWAEAVVLYRQMREEQPYGDLPLYLTGKAAQDEAEAMQESRRAEDVSDEWAGAISAWLDKPVRLSELQAEGDFEDVDGPKEMVVRTRTCLPEIWEKCFGKDKANYTPLQQQPLRRALDKVKGWEGPRNGRRVPVYGFQRVRYRQDATLEEQNQGYKIIEEPDEF